MLMANKRREAKMERFDIEGALKSNPGVDPEELAIIRQILELAEKSGYPRRRRRHVTPPGSRRRVRVNEEAKLEARTVKLRRRGR